MYHLNSKIMIQKTFFAMLVVGCLSFGAVSASPLVPSHASQNSMEESVSYETAVVVCLQLEKSGVISLDTSLNLYKSGVLTITKISSGKYSVVFPVGAGDIILITDI